MSNGILFVLSAPSGAGKSTLAKELRKKMPEIHYSISLTTRRPRQDEKHGEDYFFISEKEFQMKKETNELIEYASVHGYWYGTPRPFIENNLKTGHNIILNIDVQGARQIKKIYPDSVLIFIAPPSLSELESRLRGRRQDDEIAIQKRLNAARAELEAVRDYDYLVLNEKVDRAVEQLRCIILTERSRVGRVLFSLH